MVLDWMINDEKGFFRNKTDVITFFNYNLNTFIIFELLYILLTALISCLLTLNKTCYFGDSFPFYKYNYKLLCTTQEYNLLPL